VLDSEKQRQIAEGLPTAPRVLLARPTTREWA
jgi:hypothetical protein